MPGPIVPRPAPTPSAIALPSLPAWAKTLTSSRSMRVAPLSVTFGSGRAAHVDGREGRKDERLKRRHQSDLEDEEHDRHRERQHAHRGEAQQYDESAAHEQDQQVAGE